MRILAMTNLYPNPFQPNRAPFNRHRFRLLGQWNPLRVISPIAWTDEVRARWRGAPALQSRRVVFDDLVVDHPRYLFPPRMLHRYSGAFYLASVRATFNRALADFRPDILCAPWAYPDGWAAVQLGRRARLPVVIMVHGSDVLLLDQFPARRRPTEDALRAADGVVAVSKDLSEHLVAMGVSPDRIFVNCDGVDMFKFHPGSRNEARGRLTIPDGDPLLLFVGNLVPVKGVEVLLAACGQLLKDGFPTRLDVVGEGPLRSALERQANHLNLTGRVRFLGSLPQKQLPDRYRAADLFVLPSYSEGVPNVLLEASACDTPWVASRVGGIPEIAAMGRSRLIPSGDPGKLAGAIRETLADPPPSPDSANGPSSREASVAHLAEILDGVYSRAGSALGKLTAGPPVVSTEIAGSLKDRDKAERKND